VCVLDHLWGQGRGLASTCNNLFSGSNFRAFFDLFNAVASGRIGSSRGPENPGSRSPEGDTGAWASWFCSHFSQRAPRLYRGVERGFIGSLRSDRCFDPSLRWTLCHFFAIGQLTVAVSGLSDSAASGPSLVA